MPQPQNIDEEKARILLQEIAPAIRDILWCALVWNDHNFGYPELLSKVTRAATALGLDRRNGVEWFNDWMERVDSVLCARIGSRR